MHKILLVEDERMLQNTFEIIMSSQPYFVDVADNGQAALSFCSTKEYDLILLDLMMPILDGVGFMNKFMHIKPEKTKIVILSNLSSGEDLGRAMDLGATRSVLKSSMSPKELLSMIRYELEAG